MIRLAKIVFCNAILLGSMAGGAAFGQGADEVNDQAWEELIGEWTVEQVMMGDRELPAEQSTGTTMSFKKFEVTMIRSDSENRQVAALEIDATVDPIQFELSPNDTEEDQKMFGILKIEDNQLVMRGLLVDKEAERDSVSPPADFTSEAESETMQFTLKRVPK